MNRRRRAAAAIAVAACALGAARAVPADVSLRWQAADSPRTSMLADYLVDSNVLSDFVGLIDANFDFERPLVIVVGAAAGPDLDETENAIRLPHTYLERAVRAQATLLADGLVEAHADEAEALAVRRALDTLEYTLYHLLGHALAGSGEADFDVAAEALSSWVMLAHWPDGAGQWATDVAAFADLSQRLDGPLSDYWHAHALSAAGERELLCLVVGRDPAQALTAPRGEDAAAWRRGCRERWERLDAEARESLVTVLRPDAPLRRGAWRDTSG